MFVFVCSAYIKVPICVLAGGAMGKRLGEVCWGAVRLCGLALCVFLFILFYVACVKAQLSNYSGGFNLRKIKRCAAFAIDGACTPAASPHRNASPVLSVS